MSILNLSISNRAHWTDLLSYLKPKVKILIVLMKNLTVRILAVLMYSQSLMSLITHPIHRPTNRAGLGSSVLSKSTVDQVTIIIIWRLNTLLSCHSPLIAFWFFSFSSFLRLLDLIIRCCHLVYTFNIKFFSDKYKWFCGIQERMSWNLNFRCRNNHSLHIVSQSMKNETA